jgi:hypothetical protein
MNFQKIVLTIAIIIFILLLIFIASVLYNNKYNVSFPATVSQCPDYWLDMGKNANSSGDIDNSDSQTNQSCVNIKNLGNKSCQKKMDFTGDFWQGSTGSCNKSKWAKKCDLTWDGITNNSNICS